MAQAQTSIVLPKSIVALKKQFFRKYKGTTDILKLITETQKDNSPKLNPSQKVVAKYCGNALFYGRPLDTVIIFMAGATGTGKSSTINSLFNDKNLCLTSQKSSETSDVFCITKELMVSAEESIAFQGNLTFVDVPGTFSTDATKEAENMAKIHSFRERCPELVNRTENHIIRGYVKKTVYPNIVLFVASASDERLDGDDSIFIRSLKTFQKTANLIDIKNPNVIVVLTHAMGLGPDESYFTEDFNTRKASIQHQFKEILNIDCVEVIPVENQPERFVRFGLKKVGDFYKLPNGHLSHLNLFEAMKRCFEKNGDLLGKMLVAHYFSDDCPEKAVQARVDRYDQTCTPIELAQVATSLESLYPSSVTPTMTTTEEIPLFSFHSMSYGFCPVTEEVKPVTPIHCSQNEWVDIQIGSAKFRVPEHVKAYTKMENNFHMTTFLEKADYEQHMKHKYGLEADFKLAVSVDSAGKWLNTGQQKNSVHVQHLSMVYERKLAVLKLSNPIDLVKTSQFSEDLDQLPEDYTPETAYLFQAFFSRWGSHLIQEQGVGGTLKLNCTIQKSSVDQSKLSQVGANAQGVLEGALSGKADYNFTSGRSGLNKLGICNEHLTITGGNPPDLVDWDGIEAEDLTAWARSVPVNPAEIPTSLKLFPYYNFLSGKKCNALRVATQKYVGNTLSHKIEPKTEEAEGDRNRIAKKTKEEVKKTQGCCWIV